MNNSDFIAALSLAITAIIFLVQTDDGLLKLKIKTYEKWILTGIMLVIISLINHETFERFGITFYSSLNSIYLRPTEWALIIFLALMGITLFRIFTSKIINKDPVIILGLVEKYRREKKWNKLQNLLNSVMELKHFEEHFAEKLNDTIFNDHHLIEHFASDSPGVLIQFSRKYNAASINYGEHFFHILNGLFADKSNPVFSEIRRYHNDDKKIKFLEELWSLRYDGAFRFDPTENHKTDLPIISWLSEILVSFPSNLKEEISYFLRQFPESASDKNNTEIYSEDEIKRLLSRDTVYNTIQLFRILLVEFSLTDSKSNISIDRVLVLLYSSWDFIENSTQFQSNGKVALDNDSFTINEYYLNYLFYSYLSLFLLLTYTRPTRLADLDKSHDITSWPLKQLFAKLDSLMGHDGIVSNDSKKYYLSTLIQLYFEMPDYFKSNQELTEETCATLLWYIKDSLDESPYGDVQLFRKTFADACTSFDFLKYNNSATVQRATHFYKELLPYTKDYEWRITDSTL